MSVPAGTYRARATGWVFGASRNGTEQIAVTFSITEGEHQGQTITWYGYLSDEALARTVEGLRYCGWNVENVDEVDKLSTNEVELVVEEDEYEGKLRSKVRWVNAIRAELPPEEQRKIALRIRDRVRAKKAEAKPSTAADDEVPF